MVTPIIITGPAGRITPMPIDFCRLDPCPRGAARSKLPPCPWRGFPGASLPIELAHPIPQLVRQNPIQHQPRVPAPLRML